MVDWGKLRGSGLLTDLGPAELKPIPVKTNGLFISARIRDNIKAAAASSNSSDESYSSK